MIVEAFGPLGLLLSISNQASPRGKFNICQLPLLTGEWTMVDSTVVPKPPCGFPTATLGQEWGGVEAEVRTTT